MTEIQGFLDSAGLQAPLAIYSSPARTCSIMLTNCIGGTELEATNLISCSLSTYMEAWPH